MVNKALITTLDNLPILKQQISILSKEVELGILSEIIVVNNGSADSTKQWLDTQGNLTVIHKENNGAGPGRNAGIDIAGEFDHLLLLDGGIRPLISGTERMLEYLNSTPKADVIGVEIPDFETDERKAWRYWPEAITKAYRNTRLSHTAYCLTRSRAWDGIRFCEDGPFGEKAWGTDDDLMAYQWRDLGIIVHVVAGIHPYRRASGSFNRLFQETGIWPNQYGSGYEKRLVYLQQNYPNHQPGIQWGEPWLTVIIKVSGLDSTIKMIKTTHELLRLRRFKDWNIPNPYSIIAWESTPEFLNWAQWRHLRQHHGDTTIINGKILRKTLDNEGLWTGDFIVCDDDYKKCIRKNAYYYTLVESEIDIIAIIERYNTLHPCTGDNWPPLCALRSQI